MRARALEEEEVVELDAIGHGLEHEAVEVPRHGRGENPSQAPAPNGVRKPDGFVPRFGRGIANKHLIKLYNCLSIKWLNQNGCGCYIVDSYTSKLSWQLPRMALYRQLIVCDKTSSHVLRPTYCKH